MPRHRHRIPSAEWQEMRHGEEVLAHKKKEDKGGVQDEEHGEAQPLLYLTVKYCKSSFKIPWNAHMTGGQLRAEVVRYYGLDAFSLFAKDPYSSVELFVNPTAHEHSTLVAIGMSSDSVVEARTHD